MGLYTSLKGPQKVNMEAAPLGPARPWSEILGGLSTEDIIKELLAEQGELPVGQPPTSGGIPGLLREEANMGAPSGDVQPFPGPQLPPGVDLSSLPSASPTPGRSPEDIMNLARQARELQELGTAPLTAETQAAEKEARTAEIEAKAAPTEAVAAPQEGMDPNTKSMLLRLASGLTSAGRELAATPTLAEVQRGQFRRDVKPEKLLSGAAEEIEKEQKELEKGKTSALVKLYNEKYAKPRGLPEARTDQEAAEGIEVQQMGAELARTEAQTTAIEGEAIAETKADEKQAADMEAIAKGDLSKLPKDAGDALQKKKDAFYNNQRINKLKGQVDAAQSIKSRIDSSESYGATSAFRSLARAAGEVGVMTDKDIRDFSERMGFKGLYDRAYRLGKSSLSPELRREIFKVADSLTKDAREGLAKEVDSRVRDLTSRYSYLSEDSVRKFFVGDEIAAETRKEQPTVTVRGSDGELHTLPATAPDGKPTKIGDTFKLRGVPTSVLEVLPD